MKRWAEAKPYSAVLLRVGQSWMNLQGKDRRGAVTRECHLETMLCTEKQEECSSGREHLTMSEVADMHSKSRKRSSMEIVGGLG